MGKYSKGKALAAAQANLAGQQGITPEQMNAEMGRLRGMRPRQINALNAAHQATQPPMSFGNDIALPPGGMQQIQPWPGAGGAQPMPRPMRPPGSPHTMPVGQAPTPLNAQQLQQMSQALGGLSPVPKQPMSMNQQPVAGFLSNLSSGLNSYKW